VRYFFEHYALDPDRRELLRGSDAVDLEPQVFDLLLYLIQSREHVVNKDELIAKVWHGRIVSDSALSTRINAVRAVLGDNGETQRLIKTLPRRGVRFVGIVREDHASALSESSKASAAVLNKPSIAVLPFANLSSDPEQEYFSDGIVEDITTALSRNHAFFVVARNSSFTFKGKGIDIPRAGRELGVRYLLEGSVRKVGARVRVTGQLIEVESGHHLWADRFDGDVTDIFDMQDRIVTRVVGAIAARLERAEIDRVNHAQTDDLVAYDLYLRGLSCWNRWTKEENAKALQFFYAAIDKDRDYSTPYGLAASCHFFAKVHSWQPSFDEKEIARLIDGAATIGIDDPVALSWAGHVHAFFFKDLARGLWLTERALELDVNLATAWQRSGWVRAYAGNANGAIESLNNAIQLDPLDPRAFLTQTAMAFAHFIAGRDDDAAKWAAKALQIKPEWQPALRMMLASHGMRGRKRDAERVLRAYVRLDPEVSIRKICGFYPFGRTADRERLVTALQKAGVPEI
jgi:TolB-like protein